ncbi:hypothetical protein D3C78_1424740 [compost metagenome]
MIVHRSQIDPRLGGDSTQRGLGETSLGEQLLRRIENALDGFRLNHDHSISRTFVSSTSFDLFTF